MHALEKTCSVCAQTKLLCDFPRNPHASSGLHARCKTCHNRIGKEKRNPEAHRRHMAAYYVRTRLDRLLSLIRNRARKAGLAYDLDDHRPAIRARFDRGVCEMTGIAFVIQNGRHWASPSIDRIDPKKGYVYSNVRIVLDMMNVAMNAYGEDTLRHVMSTWLEDR